VTLVWNANGVAEGDFRAKGIDRLRLLLRTKKQREAQQRHDAVALLFRQRRIALIGKLRRREVSIERVTEMVAAGESLEVESPPIAEVHASWGTVSENAKRYVEWLDSHPNKANATTANAGYQLKRFEEYEYEGVKTGDRLIDEVPGKLILAYQKSFVDAETSVNSITVYVGRVTSLWRWVQKQEEREARDERRAMRVLYLPIDTEMVLRKRQPRERALNEEEIALVVAATPEQLLFPIAVALMCGLRLGEVMHLRPGIDVDLDIGSITVREQPDWKPKTTRSRRTVPMAPQLIAIAKRHVQLYANGSWMLPSPTTPTRPMDEKLMRLHFIAIVERTDITYGRKDPQGVTFHTLRHTFASRAVMRGIDLYTVAQLLGDSLKMVEDTYAHLSQDFKRAAIARVAESVRLPNVDEMTQETSTS
jgi:integrase